MKLLGWYDDVVLWPQCHVHHRSHHHVLYMHDAKLDFGRCMLNKIYAGPKFEFFHEFRHENFKPNSQGMVQTSFGRERLFIFFMDNT